MRTVISVVMGICAVVFLFGALGAGGTPPSTGGRYLFLPARQNLWAVDKEKGAVIFFKFPDTDDRPIQRSRTFTIDPARFPRDRTKYLLSIRNLTSLLWVVNEDTGEVETLSYRRDGTFAAEFHLMAAQQFDVSK